MTRSEEIRQRLQQIDAQIGNAKLPETLPELPAVKASDSEGIKNLQERLRSLGFYTGPVDGLWAGRTQAAVQQYNQARQAREARISEAQAPLKPLLEEQARLSRELSDVSRQEAYGTPAEVAKRIIIQAAPAIAGTAQAFMSAPGNEKKLRAKDAVRLQNANALAADIAAVDPESPLAREQYKALAQQAKQGGYYKTNRTANSLAPAMLPIAAGLIGRFGIAPAFYTQGQDTAGDIATAGGAWQLGLGGTQLFLGGLNNALTPQVISDSDVARFRMADAAARTTKGGHALAYAVPVPAAPSVNALAAAPPPPEPEAIPAQEPMPAEQLLARDPRYQQYLADQEAILRGQAAISNVIPTAAPANDHTSRAINPSIDEGTPSLNLFRAAQNDPAVRKALEIRLAELTGGMQNAANSNALAPRLAVDNSAETVSSSATGNLASLQAQLEGARDPAEIEALKARIAELQGQFDEQSARRAAAVEKAGVTRAINAGAARLQNAPVSEIVRRAKAIDPEANWPEAREVLARQNQRIGSLTADQLKAELEELRQKTKNLSKGRMITLLMRAKTLGVPGAVIGAGAALGLGAGSNPADSAPQGGDESTAHYLARRAYPAASAAANAGSYFLPVAGPARMGADALNIGMNAYDAASAPDSVIPAAPQTLTGNLAAGRQYGRSDVPPLPPQEYADPRLPDPRQAEHDRLVQAVAAARQEDLRQRIELENRQAGGSGSTLSPAQASSFDEALARLKQALIEHRLLTARQPAPPANSLLQR